MGAVEDCHVYKSCFIPLLDNSGLTSVDGRRSFEIPLRPPKGIQESLVTVVVLFGGVEIGFYMLGGDYEETVRADRIKIPIVVRSMPKNTSAVGHGWPLLMLP